MPKVSVLMPIFNTKEKFLREAIESILNQTFTDFEFLILNDSPDNKSLDDIVNSFKDDRIKYIKNEYNMGISKSRNKLIDLAKGEYLAVMDHDDISLPERFEKEVSYLDENSDVGVVGCRIKTVGLIKQFGFRKLIEDHDIKLALMSSCNITHPSSMIRKSVLIDNNIRYEEDFSPTEDYALWCRLIPYTKFHNLDEILFLYRYYKKNTSHKQFETLMDKAHEIWTFVREQNPKLYDEFLWKAKHIKHITFLGIPFLRIVSKGITTKWYLFGLLLIFKCVKNIKYRK